jgi:5-methylcytosine-specific restriction endonuclease McrA
MEGTPRQARYCSTRCRWDAFHLVASEKRKRELRIKGVALVGDEVTCAYEPCSATFAKRSPTGKFCSLDCRRASLRVKQPNRTPVYFKACSECGSPVANANKSGTPKPCQECQRELLRGRNARKNHKRRAVGKPVLSTRQIAERDGNNCHLCGKDVDLSLSGRHQRGPTIDHIVPVSLGGTNDPENLALAHRDCNVKKSNRGVALLPTPA